MCGFLVIVARPGRFSRQAIEGAAQSIHHRGPDDGGTLHVEAGEHLDVWMGHRRLSIVDLSSAGHQPMVRPGRGAIAFNGEIYNHRELRPSLEDRWEFESRSDTEVLLAGLVEDGPTFLSRANAMAAAVVWDERRSRLIIARDRLGKKPLFVYRHEEVLGFASELKAFHALGLPMTLDETAVSYFRWLNYVPGPLTPFHECQKFPAASWATVDLAAREPQLSPPRLFWDPFAALGSRSTLSYPKALDACSDLIDDATALRLEADAPVGVFLSGGIDSSLVASSVAARRQREITSFIVKADDASFDESATAGATALALGLDSVTLHLRQGDYPAQVDRVAYHYDDLCAPLSQLATMAIAQAAREHVKVVLTGDGGDEVFLGYPWLAHSPTLWRAGAAGRALPAMQRVMKSALDRPVGSSLVRLAARALHLRSDNVQSKVDVVRRALVATHPVSIHEEFVTILPRGALALEDAARLGDETLLERIRTWYPSYSWDALEERTIPEALGAIDLVLDMRDHILVKVDRGTMAFGLEARSPLLDYRIVELGLSLPLEYKLDGRRTKRILRDLCARRLGSALASRRKTGFGIPLPDSVAVSGSVATSWNAHVERAWRARWRHESTPS